MPPARLAQLLKRILVPKVPQELKKVSNILAAIQSHTGSPPALSDRMCIATVLYRARTGTPWRDLPADFGHWDAVYNRLRRWERRGLWRELWERLQVGDCPMTRHLCIDATLVRAHQHAAQALGRSRGGWSTTIHGGCRDERTSVAVVLTAGHCHESPAFEPVCAQVPPAPPLTHTIMDKGDDSKHSREHLVAHDIVPVIPSKRHRTEPIDYDKDL